MFQHCSGPGHFQGAPEKENPKLGYSVLDFHHRNDDDIIISKHPHSALPESFWEIRTFLQPTSSPLVTKPPKQTSVTFPHPGRLSWPPWQVFAGAQLDKARHTCNQRVVVVSGVYRWPCRGGGSSDEGQSRRGCI